MSLKKFLRYINIKKPQIIEAFLSFLESNNIKLYSTIYFFLNLQNVKFCILPEGVV